MCFYRENQLFAKRNFSKLGQLEKPVAKETSLPEKQNSDEVVVEDQLSKKKKILDEKAPGLFDHLTRLSQEDVSTEATSEASSDMAIEEFKQNIIIPTPIKIQEQIAPCDLSSVVQVRLNNSPVETFQIPAFESPITQIEAPARDIFEDVQRQRILTLMNQNTLIMNSIISSQDSTQKNILRCLEELKGFKTELNETNKSQLEKIEQLKEQKKHSNNFDNNPTPNALFHHFFGSGHIYRYEIVLDSTIPSPIFRERNLIIKAKIVDILTKQPIKNQNRLVFHLSLHTWEIPSNPILRNKSGNKAIMGDTEVDVKNGEAVFDRIQINEVTSKFIHGYVAALIIPANPSNVGTSLSDSSAGDNYIDFESIKPLMLEKVVVKSKKKNNQKKHE